MTLFYLVRHGEPDWSLNEQHRLKGHGRDLPSLTERGIMQAKKAAQDERLKAAKVIVSSPYTRALQTAAILSKELHIDLRVEFDLREWQPDLTFELDSLERLRELTDEYERYNGMYPEGERRLWETKQALKQRMDGVLDNYQHVSHVIVVAHGEIIRTQTDVEEIPYCSIIEVNR